MKELRELLEFGHYGFSFFDSCYIIHKWYEKLNFKFWETLLVKLTFHGFSEVHPIINNTFDIEFNPCKEAKEKQLGRFFISPKKFKINLTICLAFFLIKIKPDYLCRIL